MIIGADAQTVRPYMRSHSSFYQFFCRERTLFPTEIGRNLAPFLGLPFDDARLDFVRTQPVFGPFHNLIEGFGLWGSRQFRLTFLIMYPQNGVVTV